MTVKRAGSEATFWITLLSAVLISSGICAQCPPHWTFTGGVSGDQFGFSVAGAGDVNRDGRDDVIIGAWVADTTGAVDIGNASVYSGATGELLWVFYGEAPGDAFGFSVSGAGDVNGDGFADVIVGASQNSAAGHFAGRAYIFSGQTGLGLDTLTGEFADDNFGFSVSGAGDVDNDGFDDVIVGGFGNDEIAPAAGKVYVYSPQLGSMIYTLTGEAGSDIFGFSVSGAGDVNNDGFADLIVGASQNGTAGTNAGRVYVFSGQSGLGLDTLTGEGPGNFFGFSVSSAGDVDNDGFDDVIVGALEHNATTGKAYIYSIQKGLLLHSFVGEATDDFFGASVSDLGDVNGDGFDDVAVGARESDSAGVDAGRAYVFSGNDGSRLYTFDGEATGDQFGLSLSGASDVNDDGVRDLLVGAWSSDSGGVDAGRAYVHLLGDIDVDGIDAGCDNCPKAFNPGQEDTDNDGKGDACFLPAHLTPVRFVARDTIGPDPDVNLTVVDPDGYMIGADSFGVISNTIGPAASYFQIATNDSIVITEPKVGDYQALVVSEAGTLPPGARAVEVYTIGIRTDGTVEAIFGPFTKPTSGIVDTLAIATQTYVFGDANGDHSVNIGDVTFVIAFIFSGGEGPSPAEAGDADCSGAVNIADVTYLIAHIFSGGAAPGCE